ncbi:PLxRFG domain-containing protein [Solimonas marina]|uniref:PLxRFG domain-containing protein n=1 Tax=Solimonas marina TaxID=2714601 RepID=A0A969W708_9GAMM|nr:PLxRFG domain-containing protein [Solimonas marina]NKF21567.1 PLxRFG domain-containing protein [Solimonas marina]
MADDSAPKGFSAFSGTLDPAPSGFTSFDGATDEEVNRSPVGEIGNQLKAGAEVELPQMIGQGLQYGARKLNVPDSAVARFGKRIADAAAKRGERPDLQPHPDEHNFITNTLASGARQIPPSIGVMLPLAATARVAPGVVPNLAPEIAGGVSFGLSQAQDTFNKAKAAGLSDAEAERAADRTGLIEGAGETIGGHYLGKFADVTGKALGGAAKGAEQGILKPYLKSLAKTAAVETGTEMGQNYGEAAVEKNAGIDQTSPWEAAKEAVAPTLGMTALLAPFGLAGHVMSSRGTKQETVDPVAAQEMQRHADIADLTQAAQQPAAGPLTKAVGLNPDAAAQAGQPVLDEQVQPTKGRAKSLGGEFRDLQKQQQADEDQRAAVNDAYDGMMTSMRMTQAADAAARQPRALPAPPPAADEPIDGEYREVRGPIPAGAPPAQQALPSPATQKPGGDLVQGADGLRRQTYAEADAAAAARAQADAVSGRATGIKAPPTELRNPKDGNPWRSHLAANVFRKKLDDSDTWDVRRLDKNTYVLARKQEATNGEISTPEMAAAGNGRPSADAAGGASVQRGTDSTGQSQAGRNGDRAGTTAPVGAAPVSVERAQPQPSPTLTTTDGKPTEGAAPVARDVKEPAPEGAAEDNSLPDGWTESSPGRLATNQDPERGGIVDRAIKSGKWFVVPNRDGIGTLKGFATRAEALRALDKALSAPNAQPEAKAAPEEGAATNPAGQAVTTPAADAAPTTAAPTEIRRADGTPFPSKLAAGAARARAGQKETHDVVPVDGGYALRPKVLTSPNGAQSNVPTEEKQSVTSGNAGQPQVTEPGPAVPAGARRGRGPATEGQEKASAGAAGSESGNRPVLTPTTDAAHETRTGTQQQAATATVVDAAAKKSATAGFNPREAKAALLKEIDATKPAEDAEAAATYGQIMYEMKEQRRKAAGNGDSARKALLWITARETDTLPKLRDRIGYVRFNVPGDGRFKVLNTPENLAAFRKKVEKSEGFKGKATKASAAPAPNPVKQPKPVPASQSQQESTEPAPTKMRDNFTVERLNRDTNRMETVTFQRGEYVRAGNGQHRRPETGEIEGVSHTRGEFKLGGVWYKFGAAYKTERPARPTPTGAPLSSVVDAVNAKNGEGLTDADRVPDGTPFTRADTAIEKLHDGSLRVDEYKAAFAGLVDDPASVKTELSKKTKDTLLSRLSGYAQARYKNDKKADIVEAVYASMRDAFALGKSYGPTSYFMGQRAKYEADKLNALKALVNGQTAESLAEYAASLKAMRDEAASQREAAREAVKNPKTLDEFNAAMRAKIAEGMPLRDARLTLSTEQRAKYDRLAAEKSHAGRADRKDEQRAVHVAGQKVDSQIIETKHTQKGHDLFVVQLAERVPREDYETLNAGAKKLGGYYSAFRGRGAVPGFQFRERTTAEAFVKLANGDATQAREAAQARRDAFEDDRSQTAVERLNEMADRLKARAEEALSVERKANTARRARMAASAEGAARADQALAKTMRNIAQAIADGRAEFLDRVRTKSQVEMLEAALRSAKGDELRAKYESYGEQLKRQGQPATDDTVEYANFPAFTLFRSDLAALARQLEEVNGFKQIAQKLAKVADDVSAEYTKFAKENFHKVAPFAFKDGTGAIFANREDAERAIKRSGLRGKAIVMPLGRGKNAIVMSPAEAIGRGIWQGDGDKRITLKREFATELVDKLKGRRDVQAPWQFVAARDRLAALSRMGIETAPEYRAALRELIGLREQAQEADRVKELERSMVGRANDGLDFFPTPASVADAMIDSAGIQPDMAVLEPSAGMGHIADRIRAAGAEPDVIEISANRRELLEAKGYHFAWDADFLKFEPRSSFTYGDVFQHTDGRRGVMRGGGGMGSGRVGFVPEGKTARESEWVDRDDLTGVEKRGVNSGYDRIIMNPPFSDGRDMQHVRHAYDLLKPGGRLVAIMGEGAFFRDTKQAREFRDWLVEIGGSDEKLAEGTFLDPSLPVNTGVSARMVVIEKPAGSTATPSDPDFRLSPLAAAIRASTVKAIRAELDNRFGAAGVQSLIDRGILNVVQRVTDLPENIQRSAAKSKADPRRIRGLYDGSRAFLVADNSKAEDATSLLLHEIGEHYGLKAMVGDENYARLLNDVRRMRAAREPGVTSAWNRVERNYRHLKPGEDRFVREVIAHVGETGDALNASWFQRLVQAVKRFLWSKGWRVQLNDNDLRSMIVASLRRVMNGGEATATATVDASLATNTWLEKAERRMSKMVDEWQAGKVRPTDTVLLGDTPPVLRALGAPSAQIEVIASTLQKTQEGKHKDFGITPEMLKRLPSQLYDPLAVFQSERGDTGLVVVTELADRIGNPVIAAVHIGKQSGRAVVNRIASVYSKENAEKTFKAWADSGLLRYVRNDEGPELTTTGPLYLGKVVQSARSLGTEYKTAADVAQADRPLFSLADANAPQSIADVRQKLGDFLDTRRTFNRWWHETVGTQYHKAQVDKDFGRVFNRTQEYLTDVSRYALGAADAAQEILPRFETFGDLTKSGASPRDLKPVADAIFRGTLDDQKVFTDAELRDRFKLNPKQVRLYRQARAAINKSLSDVAITDMVKLARPGISDAVARQAAAADTLEAARDILAAAAPDIATQFDQKIGRVRQLMAEGYAPLMRFGEYSLHVTNKAGETVYFGMYETAGERNRVERLMREQYPNDTVSTGVVNDETYQMFKGMTPETLELFAGVTGMDKDEAFQQYLKLTKNNRSALKRLIHRKGIEGYNPDLKRVLAQFLTSNARAASSNLHMGEMTKAWAAIPKDKGDVQKQAGRLIQYIQNPREEAQGLRSFLFFNFLGGSVASAMVNMTQPVTMTLPYLAQWGAGRAGKELTAGMRVAVQRPGAIRDAGLRAAMMRAIKDGTVEPHQIHELSAASMRKEGDWGRFDAARTVGRKALVVWGRMFALAEQFNRRSTFAAAYQIGRTLSPDQLEKAGVPDAYAFAVKAVQETQGVYNRGNRPNWARGAVGATLFTFKQYSISYLEFLKRLPRQQRAMALGVLFLAAGANGLPGADDLDDLIDTIAQGLGLSWNTKEERAKAIGSLLTPIFGSQATDFVQNGVSTFLPIDVQGRLGMQNLIPGTGIGLKSQKDKGREIAEAVGPIGRLAENYGNAAAGALSGDVGETARNLIPGALENMLQGYLMAQLGYYKDQRGRRVIDTTVADSVAKAIGFNPEKVARESRAMQVQRQDIELNRATSSEIADQWAQGIFERDQDKVNNARARLMRWNARNPDSRIIIQPSQIQRRVKEMQMTRSQRFIKSAPKGLREQVTEAVR